MAQARQVDEEPLLWSVHETARRLGVTDKHVKNLITRKVLPSVLVGHRRMVPVRRLQQWIEENTV